MPAMWRRFLAVLAALLIPLVACNFPRSGGPAPSNPEMVFTAAAQTVQAQLTQAATGVLATVATPGAPPAAATPPSGGASPTPAEGASATPQPTGPSPTAGACEQAEFVKDITYPDNTLVEPGSEFTKTWQLRNTSDCTWNSSYSIVFDHGDAMGAPPSLPLTAGAVPPGQTVDVSVTFQAPDEDGTYQGYWRLRNPAGQVFGLGSDADDEFWVKVRVGAPQAEGFDFIAQASKATWVGSGGGGEVTLGFGGADDDPNGTAKLKEDITLENGSEAGKTLVTHPKRNDDGRVSGTFPEYTVQEDDRFKAKLGFLEDCGEGQVVFQLWYQEGDDLNQVEEWEKSCNGSLVFAEADLAELEGKRVRFVLVVLADGSPEDDLAIWGSARIEND